MSDEAPFIVFDERTRKHLFEEHPDPRPTEAEIIEAMTSQDRIEAPDPDRPELFNVLAEISTGRWVFVVWVRHPRGRRPIHAR